MVVIVLDEDVSCNHLLARIYAIYARINEKNNGHLVKLK